MTEPPQPPNQPPTPSGYGHLPGPPQQGYGYPPQGGANPYAQQPPTVPQPLAQHGYGFPPPGMPPGPPPGAPGAPGAPGRRKALIAVAASVAGVLVLGAGAYFAFGDGGGDPKPPVAQASTPPADPKPDSSPSVDKGDGSGNGGAEQTDLNAGRKQGEDKALWLKTAKMEGPGAGIVTKGQWVVGDTVVKTIDKTLVGYAVTDGKEKWKLDLGAELCGHTHQTTADGKTVIVVQDASGSECNQMKLIDLKAGTAGWTKEVAKEGLFDSSIDVSPSITGDTVAINRMTKSTAYRISTGDKLFSGSGPEGCQPSTYVGGNGKMIAVATCHDADLTQEVQDADPATGKTTWSYKLPKGWRVTSVYSVDPIVLDIGNRDTKERAVITLGPDGKKRSSMAAEGQFQVNCGNSTGEGLQGCGSSAVDANTLYLMTVKEGGYNNEVVAFDLTTGKAKWRTPAGDKRIITPLRAANGQLIAYRTGQLDQPGEIISIPAAGGSPTVLLRNPSGPAAKIEGSFMSSGEMDYADGRFFMSVSRLAAQGKDEKLLMVFGK
ncbi:outer membrane protein assembly factor BamB family protein [Streptomyces sp. NPDC003042]